MGEFVDAILEGIFCQTCGEPIDGQAAGHPRECGCVMSPKTRRSVRRVVGRAVQVERENRQRHEAARARKPFECGTCRKLFTTEGGLAQHKRDTHDKIAGAHR